MPVNDPSSAEGRLKEIDSASASLAVADLSVLEEKVYGPKGPPRSDPVLDYLGRKISSPQDRGSPVMASPDEVVEGRLLLSYQNAYPPQPEKGKDAPVLTSRSIDKSTKGGDNDKKVSLRLLQDHAEEFPDLWLEVFINGPRWEERAFAPMFARAHCSQAKTVAEADLVVFTGGVDVDPALYGEERLPKTDAPNRHREDMDMKVYLECLEEGIPMLGVCRGAQFLHVMNGGKLYQDVDNHYGPHPIWDVQKKTMLPRVSSVHHQMCIENSAGGMELLATSNVARNRKTGSGDVVTGPRADVEAFFYRETCCIGVQGHPEYANFEVFTKWVLELINEFVILNPDIDWVQSNRRMNPDLVVQRQARLKMPATARPASEEAKDDKKGGGKPKGKGGKNK